MKQVSGKRLAKVVTQRGWELDRVKGSHHIFTMTGRRERLVIPIHGNEPLKTGLLHGADETGRHLGRGIIGGFRCSTHGHV